MHSFTCAVRAVQAPERLTPLHRSHIEIAHRREHTCLAAPPCQPAHRMYSACAHAEAVSRAQTSAGPRAAGEVVRRRRDLLRHDLAQLLLRLRQPRVQRRGRRGAGLRARGRRGAQRLRGPQRCARHAQPPLSLRAAHWPLDCQVWDSFMRPLADSLSALRRSSFRPHLAAVHLPPAHSCVVSRGRVRDRGG